MRKIGAYLLGVFLLLLLGAALIHPSLLVVADWLGPVFGSSVYLALTMAFLMLGDPLGIPILLFIWLFVALLIGCIVRRRMGAVGVVLLVWLTMLPIMASTVFAIAENVPNIVQGTNGPMDWLPPLPSGMTLTSIFEAPIVGKIVKVALEALNGNMDVRMLVEQVIVGLVTDVALKPVLLVVGTLIGVELGRLVEKRGLSGLKPSPKTAPAKAIAMLLIVCISLTPLIPSVSGVQFGEEAYIEAMVGALDKKGRAYIGDVFADTSSTLSGMGLSGSDTNGLAAAVVISHSGVIDILRKLISQDSSLEKVTSLVNLLPPTFAVVVYLGVPEATALQRSVSVSSALSSTYGVSLSKLTSFSMQPGEGNQTEQMPLITLAFYQSSSDVGVFADNYLTQFRSRGGFADAIGAAVDNGRLVPGETVDSASGAVFAAGFVNVDALMTYLSIEDIPEDVKGALGAFLSGSITFAGGVSFWDNGAQPTDGSDNFDFLDLLGTNTTPSYSPTSDFSTLLTFAPPGENVGGGEDVPNIKISTSVPLTQEELDAVYRFFEDMGYVVRVTQGAPSPGSFQINTADLTLPLNVEVTKTITGGETATVTVTVTNKDTEPMTSVTLDDSDSLLGYTEGVDLVSGDTTGTWDVIPPGESRTITYTVRIDNPGVYTLEPAGLSYTGGGVEFSDTSNRIETVASRPFFLFVPFELTALTWMMGSQLLDMVTGRGVIIMSVITLGFVALIVWDGFRSYKRWSKPKEASVVPQPESGDKSEVPQ
jgi:hypothetical protein